MRFGLSFLCLASLFANGTDPFLVKPYLQLGADPKQNLALLWHTSDSAGEFSVQSRKVGAVKWSKPVPATSHRIAVHQVEPHRVWSATLNGMKAGADFEYRVLHGGKPVFESRARARKSPRQAQRFVVFGDCGQNSLPQKQVAFQTFQAKPDYVVITGDIVYSRGRVPEYREKHFPVYAADVPSPETGAPLLQSTLFVGAPGNHDIATFDFEKYPDTQAYYYYWKQPLNGPLGEPGPLTSKTTGPADAIDAFRQAAGANYPRMANFSFDYGNAHWTILDGNPYVNWKDPAVTEWLENDLRAAAKSAWRFVAFHHPGFNSSKAHFKEQQTRVLAPIFEKHRVHIVFAGHVHNYQRSYPMHYDPETGKWTLDKTFDGKTQTRPDGVIYIVTGAGGARLYNPEQHDDPSSWQEFTARFVSNVHSLTVVDIQGRSLEMRQVDINGVEVDRIAIRQNQTAEPVSKPRQPSGAVSSSSSAGRT